ncbi:MAG: hypothetical protein Q9157_004329 [Trypethelium eluteriae]
MLNEDSPPPYPGPPSAESPRPLADTESTQLRNEKDPRRSQESFDSRHHCDASSTLKPGPSRLRASSAPGSDFHRGSFRATSPSVRAQASATPPKLTFQAYNTKVWFGRTVDITINGKTDVAFHVTYARSGLFTSKPDLTIQRASTTGPIIATAYMRSSRLRQIAELLFPETGDRVIIDRVSL